MSEEKKLKQVVVKVATDLARFIVRETIAIEVEVGDYYQFSPKLTMVAFMDGVLMLVAGKDKW